MKKLFYSVLGLLAFTAANAQTSVYDVISSSPNHTILTAALIQEGLDVTLSNTANDYTVFAPDDAAFNQFLADNGISAGDLLADPDLTKVLLHHVVSGTVTSGMLTNGEVVTLSDLDVTVDLTMGVMIDDAEVTGPDLTAPNGVVHSMDYVLLPTYDDVTEVVSTSADHTTLLAALQTAGLVSTLQDQNSDFTVFAPTDAAFTQFLSDAGISAADLLADPDLATVLLHHVVSGTVTSGMLTNGEVVTLSDLDVTVDLSMGVMIDDAEVTLADIMADNGVVHVVDYVLLPTYDDVTEVISTSADHTTLLAALQTAGLVSTLQDQNSDFTVFAPTDAAFTQFLSDAGISAADLLADPDLATVLLHHVVSGTVTSGMLTNGEVVTLSDLDVTVDLSMGVMIDDAEVTLADIMADNGVVHVVDYVLLPTYDDVTEVISTSADHTTLLAALQTAGLVSTLQDQNSEFTVFAPTDAAFTNYLSDNGLSASDLLNASNLSEILLHHVVSGTVLSTDLSNGNVTTVNGTDVTVDLSMGVMIDDAEVTLADIIADNGVVHVLDGVLSLPAASSVTENRVEYNVYPNPFSDLIMIDAEDNMVLQVLNITGQVISNQTVQGGVINLSDLSEGTYILRFENGNTLKVTKI